MLKEDQAAELLARCERLLGRRLDQIRGNLRRAETRAAAVWELLCIDAFSRLGPIDHEPPGHASSPDMVLYVNDAPLWIEAAFLYARFWESERRARTLLKWIYREAARLKIPAVRISSHFFGDDAHGAGPLRELPDPHEKAKVLESAELRTFFAGIRANTSASRTARLGPYSVTLTYDPDATGPYVHSGGVVEEQPRTVEEHHLFRVLKGKARQHKPECPYLICVGSDQSHAISSVSMSDITERAAVSALFREEPRVSGVIAVSIESTLGLDAPAPRVARSRPYLNPHAIRPIEPAQMDILTKLDLNQWRYYFALEKWQEGDMHDFRRSGGPLRMSAGKGHISVTVPSTMLVDCLAGRTSMLLEWPGNALLKYIKEGWEIVGCSFAHGSIEQGSSNQVTLVFGPPPESVYFGDGKPGEKRSP